MKLFLLVSLFINLVGASFLFYRLYRSRKLFSERYAMIIATVFSSMFSFTVAVQLYLLLPIDLAVITFLAVLVGAGVGIVIGGIYKFQSLLSGFFQGTTGALMGTMLGAVILNPELCSLPISANSLNETIFIITLFVSLLNFLTYGIIYYSLRV